MKYAKSSNQLCSATGDTSVLFCLMSKRCMAVGSGLPGIVLTRRVLDISNSMTAHVWSINDQVQFINS